MERVILEGCVNCKACIMACSLHHTGAFSFKNGSIDIKREGKGYGVCFTEPFSCDTCEGEGIGNYQCVKFCYRAKDALRKYIESQGKGGSAS